YGGGEKEEVSRFAQSLSHSYPHFGFQLPSHDRNMLSLFRSLFFDMKYKSENKMGIYSLVEAEMPGITAHSRINPCTSPSPCHIEMILTEKEQIVPKPEEEGAQKKKTSQKKPKKQKLTAQE
ncbi:hypothetical protein A6R68_11029, partial [Neotoma lepida]